MSDWIVADPEILGGKPCVKGTRISVELILELLASGATREEILLAYPQIPPKGLTAALQYARSRLLDRVVASLDTDRERDATWDALAARRDAEIESGTAIAVSGPEVVARLRVE